MLFSYSFATTAVSPSSICENLAFDAVEKYWDDGGTDGFEAGKIFEKTYNNCMNSPKK